MPYDKENQRVLTSKVNSLFGDIAGQGRVLDDNNNGNLLQDCHYGSYVGIATLSSNQVIKDIEGILKI